MQDAVTAASMGHPAIRWYERGDGLLPHPFGEGSRGSRGLAGRTWIGDRQ
jgi:hypothetical protein